MKNENLLAKILGFAGKWLRSHWKLFIFLLIIIIIGGYYGKRTFFKTPVAPQYQTATAEKGTLIKTVSASGAVSTGNSVNISTSASGVINQVYVKNGDSVSQGQVIADITLDQDSQQRQASAWSSYLSAQNSVASANQSKLTLQGNNLTDQNNLLTAQATANSYQNYDPSDPIKQKADNSRRVAELALQVDQQKAAMTDNTIAKAQSDLNSAWLAYQLVAGKITAPITGVVGNLTIASGVVISGQSTSSSANGSATLRQLGTVTVPQGKAQATVTLSEVDVTNVKSGQKASLTIDAYPGKTFTGQVVLINTNGQVSSGVTNYPATLELDSTGVNLYPNMSVNAKIITMIENEVILVPSGSVQSSNGQATVRILTGGQINSVPVTIGDANDTQTVIVSGVNEGDTVVTSISTTRTTGSSASPFGSLGGRGFGGGGGGGIRLGGN